jgi:hypothetical protein
LLDEAADRVELAVEEHDADVVRPARQRGGGRPAVGRGVVHVVVRAVDALLAVAADDVHPVLVRGGPRHLAARQRQRGLRDPPPRRGGLRRHAVEHVLLRGELGLVDAPGLLQPLVTCRRAPRGRSAPSRARTADEERAATRRRARFIDPS